MSQLTSPLDEIDDLTIVKDPKLRRRVQNRLNQRAYRARRQGKPAQGSKSALTPTDIQQQISTIVDGHTACNLSPEHHLLCTYLPAAIHSMMSDFEKAALEKYASGSPQIDHLISLSRVNLLRAAYENVVAVGMAVDWLCADEAISILTPTSNNSNNALSPAKNTSISIPSCLKPTPLQLSTPHHPWVDIFPFPGMRDNLIRAGDSLDDDEFCHDITGFWDTRRSNATLLVWGSPWDASNWEVTEEFVHKWGWLMNGCPELLVSTNKWRRVRGEKPLDWRRIVEEGQSENLDDGLGMKA
ncbi:bZIP transcription factor [Aspergillus stella-maris]|uniref:bZIP transcription factor n=1 Tax=Aspergillus stella-maris TaxID=1810926 RepID=UPI003CCD473A